MSTDVAIANLALSHIGQRGTISSFDPPEGSEHAERAAQFFDLARDALLERHDWGFATRRVAGAEVATTVTGWAHVYAVPGDCIRVIAVQPPETGDDYVDTAGYEPAVYGPAVPLMIGRTVPQPFVLETLEDGSEVILTDVEQAVIRYTRRVTAPAKFSALFSLALSWHLASMLAGPIVKGEQGTAEQTRCLREVERLLGQARVHDTSQRNLRPQHLVPWMTVR